MLEKILLRATRVGSVSSLRPTKTRRPLTRGLVLSFAAILIIYNGIQVILSMQLTINGLSQLVQLTYIDAGENNQARIQHPYYTICPILYKSANLDDPNATLVSVMLENSFYHPLVNFLSVFNSAKYKNESMYSYNTPKLNV